MKKYKCTKCGTVYMECDLHRTKCSENWCGPYLIQFCPKCIRRNEVGELKEEEG